MNLREILEDMLDTENGELKRVLKEEIDLTEKAIIQWALSKAPEEKRIHHMSDEKGFHANYYKTNIEVDKAINQYKTNLRGGE